MNESILWWQLCTRVGSAGVPQDKGVAGERGRTGGGVDSPMDESTSRLQLYQRVHSVGVPVGSTACKVSPQVQPLSLSVPDRR